MRFSSFVFAAGLVICSAGVARSRQVPSAENPAPSDINRDCAVASKKVAADRADSELSQRPADPQNDLASPQENQPPAMPALHSDQDLVLLQQMRSALAQCILSAEAQVSPENAQGACSEMLLVNFEMRHDGESERDIPIGRLPGTSAFFFESGMTIDADGAPNAYHPDNSGIDDLKNAGAPGHWEGLAKDAEGEPFIQGPNDPFPGYYVSETALADRSKAVNDPKRYVDASKIPFVVLPGGLARQLGARVGDFAVVFNERNGKSSYAIFGDVGPYDRIGEGSVSLAENLGIRSDARNGGARQGVLYLIFPGSGEGRPRTVEEINDRGQKLLGEWETGISAAACGGPKPLPPAQENQSAN
jgi:Fungal chitosanase of glycosyl hydrolase group 75